MDRGDPVPATVQTDFRTALIHTLFPFFQVVQALIIERLMMSLLTFRLATRLGLLVIGVALIGLTGLFGKNQVSYSASPVGLNLHTDQKILGQDVLDNFNRAGPALGSDWAGTGPTLADNQLKGGSKATIFWKKSFGENQWTSLRIVQMSGCDDEVSIFLKANGNTRENGMVNVSYNPCASPKLNIYTYNPTLKNWSPFNGADVTIRAGDILSAQVQSNRRVTVFVNGVKKVTDTLHTANAGFDVARAGQIGISTSNAHVIVDDFDGSGDVAQPIDELTPDPMATPSTFEPHAWVYLPIVLSSH